MLTNSDKIIEPFTNLVNNLADNYYDKEEINQLISQTGGFIVVEELPTEDIQRNLIYLKGPIGEGRDKYEEWIYTGTPGEWTLIGDTTIDLTDYATKDFCKKTYYPLAGGIFATTVTVGPANSDIANGYLHRRAFAAGSTQSVTGSLYNGAAFGVKSDGTASFQHKVYANGSFGGAKNTAVMTFSGNSGLRFAINTGSGSDVTPDMYHDVLVDQTNYSSLQTEAKDIIGAINEVNSKSSGSEVVITQMPSESASMSYVIDYLSDDKLVILRSGSLYYAIGERDAVNKTITASSIGLGAVSTYTIKYDASGICTQMNKTEGLLQVATTTNPDDPDPNTVYYITD